MFTSVMRHILGISSRILLCCLLGLNLGGCFLTPEVWKHYGGVFKELRPTNDEVYIVNNDTTAVLVPGVINFEGKVLGRGYAEYDIREIKGIHEGELPRNAVRLPMYSLPGQPEAWCQDFINQNIVDVEKTANFFAPRDDMYLVCMGSDARLVEKVGKVLVYRHWYRWFDTGALLMIAIPLDLALIITIGLISVMGALR